MSRPGRATAALGHRRPPARVMTTPQGPEPGRGWLCQNLDEDSIFNRLYLQWRYSVIIGSELKRRPSLWESDRGSSQACLSPGAQSGLLLIWWVCPSFLTPLQGNQGRGRVPGMVTLAGGGRRKQGPHLLVHTLLVQGSPGGGLVP